MRDRIIQAVRDVRVAGRLAFVIFGVGLLYATQAAGAFQWFATADLPGATGVHGFLEAADGYVYVTTEPNGDVFRTDDNGATWENTSDLAGATVAWKIIEAGDGYIYVGTEPDGTVFKTNDSGATWIATGDLVGADVAYALLELPDDSILAATGIAIGEVFRTDDGGATWQNLGQLGDASRVTSFLLASDGSVYAGGMNELAQTAEIYRSEDLGETWSGTNIPAGSSSVCGLKEDSQGAVYIGTGYIDAYIYRTMNGGGDWLPAGDVSAGADLVHGMWITAADTIYVATGAVNGNVYSSTNSGGTWTDVGDLPGATESLAIFGPADGTIWVGTGPNGDVFRGDELTAIELVSFDAEIVDEGVHLAWVTASERDNAGFHLWRSIGTDGEYERITASLIPGEGDAFSGASYEWIDDAVVSGTYSYKLEDVDVFGHSSFHDPVTIRIAPEPSFGCGG